MQTTFSAQALRDPKIHESEKILRTCVHCGFCTATCPTYLLLGDELDSPLLPINNLVLAVILQDHDSPDPVGRLITKPVNII